MGMETGVTVALRKALCAGGWAPRLTLGPYVYMRGSPPSNLTLPPGGLQYARGAASILVPMVLLASILRLRRQADEWPDETLFGRRVKVSPDTGPATIGPLHPLIVIPRWVVFTTVESGAQLPRPRDMSMLIDDGLPIVLPETTMPDLNQVNINPAEAERISLQLAQ